MYPCAFVLQPDWRHPVWITGSQLFEPPKGTRLFPPARGKRKWAWGWGQVTPAQLMRLGIDRNVSCTVHRRRNQGGTRGMCPPLSFQSVPYISCTTNEILHTVPPPIKKSFLRLCSGWLCISSRSIFKWNVVWWLFMYKLQWYSPTWQNPLLIWKALILCSSFFQLLYLVGVLLLTFDLLTCVHSQGMFHHSPT